MGDEIINKRVERILSWLKNPTNFTIFAIIVFAVAIRLYYFFMTSSQPLWWDEAEYMNMARAWAFNLEYEFVPVRPVLFSFIASIFLRITESEVLPRLLMLLISIASVPGMYLLGKEIYDKRVGLLCAFFISIPYLSLFYSNRLLTEIPSLTFYIFSAFFFWKYFSENSPKMMYYGAIMIAIGALFKISTAEILFAVAIYSLVIYKLGIFKRKEVWIGALIFILILSPYLIWGYVKFGGFVISQAGAWNAPQGNVLNVAIENCKGYLNLFPVVFSWPILIALILGIFSMYKLVLGFDLLLKGNNKSLRRDLFLILTFIIPFLVVISSISFFEDRYIITMLPSGFVIASIFMIRTYDHFKKDHKMISLAALIIILMIIPFLHLSHSDRLIKSKAGSFDFDKNAGLWLKESTQPGEIIISSGLPLTMYYSQRDVLGFPETMEEFESLLESNKRIKYYIVSGAYHVPPWIEAYLQQTEASPVQSYLLDNGQPIAFIYKTNN